MNVSSVVRGSRVRISCIFIPIERNIIGETLQAYCTKCLHNKWKSSYWWFMAAHEISQFVIVSKWKNVE